MRGILSVFLLALIMAQPTRADVEQLEATLGDGSAIQYKIVTPPGYDSARAYPAILAFPGGRQSIERVDSGLRNFWRAEAETRGFLVISPAVPRGKLFFGEGDKAFPEFLEIILARHKIRDRKFHLGGVSNGGRSAFHIAARHTGYFTSILALPGFLPNPTPEKYAALAGLCIVMIAGERDTRWTRAEKTAADALRKAGGNPVLVVSPGDGHLPLFGYGGDNAGKLFDFIENKAGC